MIIITLKKSLYILATALAVVILILVFISLVSKKFIEMRLIEEEKELYRQLADESFTPSWPRIIAIPRTTSSFDDTLDEPPSYSSYHHQTNT
jgi:type II secretory pathway component PulL